MALLDTHALIFWLLDSPKLSAPARAAIEDVGAELRWSVVGTWEMSALASLGRLQFGTPLRELLPDALRSQRISVLPVHQAHALRVEELPFHHRDPFDRMLIAQALEEDLPIVTRDAVFATYGVRTLW